METIMKITGNTILVIAVVGFAFTVGFFAGEKSMQREAIARKVAAYCPVDGSFSWMGIITPANAIHEIIFETTDCPDTP